MLSQLAEIINTMKKTVDTGDLGAIVNGLTALEQLAVDAGQGKMQQHDPYFEENVSAAAQDMVEAGELEILRQEGKDAVWKLTPQGTLHAHLLELIGIERWQRHHHLYESEEDEKEYDQLRQEIINDLAPLLVWLTENGLLEVREDDDKLLLFVWVTTKGNHEPK